MKLKKGLKVHSTWDLHVAFSLLGSNLQVISVLNLFIYQCAGFNMIHCGPLNDAAAMDPDIPSSVDPQPFLPLLAPSPLTPFANKTLSGMFYKPSSLPSANYCLHMSDTCPLINLLSDIICLIRRSTKELEHSSSLRGWGFPIHKGLFV